MMNKNVVLIVLLSFFVAGSAAAQDRDRERDPFFSDGPRASGSTADRHDTEWGRDPFARPFDAGAGSTARRPATRVSLEKLTGIIYSDTNRIAIIGGELVREGGMVGERKLVAIRESSIVLRGGSGSVEELFLEQFSIRQ